MATESREEELAIDICRVCRTEGSMDRPLFYPCLCTGSIKYIHQECLMQWLKYSKKEYCELCNHKYQFQPIYHPDMPKRLPMSDVASGVGRKVASAVRCWIHYTVVAIAWLGLVPLTASRIYRSLFTGSVSSLLRLPLDMISTEHILADCIHGGLIIGVSLCAFIALVWLREQILHAGPPQLPDAAPEAQQLDNNQGAEGPGVAPEVEANAAEPQQQNQNNDNAQPQQGDEWRGFEWDRLNAAEELTWERLLGLDGSLVFLEHVFWVISLNTLFLLIFAFSPYHVGQLAALALHLLPLLRASQFEGVLTTLFGYVLICSGIFCLHHFAKTLGLNRAQRMTGMCYLVLKVFLLVLMEIGVFPLICGLWLDVCSLALFSSSLRDRTQAFVSAPGTSTFMRWLFGMVFVFYFATFVLILREVLRPGVLWFLRNLNDPEFNPIQEMIQFPVFRHVRRFFASVVMFAVAILLVVHFPIRTLLRLWPSLLPYNISLNAETPVTELSLELVLLQVVLPTILEQSQARTALKTLIRLWCQYVGAALDLEDYLLHREASAPSEEDGNEEGREEQLGGNLGDQHQALLLARDAASGDLSYRRPSYFVLRIVALLIILGFTCFCCSVLCLSVPVTLGRTAMGLLSGGGRDGRAIHELYTVATGVYLCWLLWRLGILILDWIPRGFRTIVQGVRDWSLLAAKCGLAAVAFLGLVPYLVGLLFQLVVIAPVRVSLHQSPLFYPWQDWAMGVVHCKIICAGLMMGPDWWLRRGFERLYQDGVRNLNLASMCTDVLVPIVSTLGLSIALPYVFVHSIVPLFGVNGDEAIVFQRHIYPCVVFLVLLTGFLFWQIRQLSGFVMKIRNEKYLVGQRLINYDRRPQLHSLSDYPLPI